MTDQNQKWLNSVKKLVKTPNPHGILASFYDPERDGVTNSVLSLFKFCRERAKLHLQGWTPKRIGTSLIFGTVVHAVLEIIYTAIQNEDLDTLPGPKYVARVVRKVERQWKKENPKADSETLQTLEMCLLLAEVVLPVYFKFWHKDLARIKWLKLEHQFKYPFVLPKTFGVPEQQTFVRGKMDGVFHSAESRDKRLWLLETKTKSRLGEQGESNLVDMLPFELQVNLYLGALWTLEKTLPGGVLYNIIRRPVLQIKKGEALVAFQQRVLADVRKRPEFYFIRLRMSVDRRDLEREMGEHKAMLTDFLDWFNGRAPHYKNSDNCEYKYGTCPMLKICNNKDYSMFYRRPTVFRELEDV